MNERESTRTRERESERERDLSVLCKFSGRTGWGEGG